MMTDAIDKIIGNIEDGTFLGQRIGDMDRAGLLRVIEFLARQAEMEKASHRGTLDMWEACRKARPKGLFG